MLKFTSIDHDFERVFVFYDDYASPYVENKRKLKLLTDESKEENWNKAYAAGQAKAKSGKD